MPHRSWLLIAALGLAFSVTLLQAQEEGQGSGQGASEEQQSAQVLPLPLPVQIIEDNERAISRERSESEARQREIDDLEAQQGMNTATQAMNEATQSMKIAAWVSTALVGLGTFLLIWTLRLTRQANNSARAAVDVTREIGEAQSRAYVHVQIANIHGLGTPAPEVAVGITNFGQTPARNVRLGTRRIIGDYRRPFTLGDVEYLRLVDLGPGQSTTVRFPIDPDLIIQANTSQEAALLAYIILGQIKYADAFCSDDRETDFAFTTWHESEIGNCQLDTRVDGNRST